MFKKITLKNGLRIIVVPQKSTQAVTVLVLVGTGSKYETKEISGISHFLEHMFFKGTKKRPDNVEIAETLDKVGGIYNAFTGEDYTGYFAKVAASNFDLALDWVSDIFLNSNLPGKEIEKEKGVIIEEINMLYDNPMAYVGLLWNKLLYGDQPAGWDIAGAKETVSAINRQKLLDYFNNHYISSNTIVCLAGNFKEQQAIEKTKRYFSSMRISNPAVKQKVIDAQEQPKSLVHYKETDQTHLRLGVRGFNLFHPKRYVQDILGNVLGGMMSSRLFIEIREKLGLAYYIKTEIESNPDTGFLVTAAGVDSKRIEKAISVILKEYKKISEEKVSPSELKKTKNNLKGRLSLSMESSDAQASFYGIQELLEKKVMTPAEFFKEIDKVSANDMLKVAKDIFQPKNLNLVLVGPFKDNTRFEKLLA
ncbi:MAG: pitrilysin family protein [bacterium]|nr:pitrilysin family protein [bacterium]